MGLFWTRKKPNLLRGLSADEHRVLLTLVPMLCDLIRGEGRSDCFLQRPADADVLEAARFLLSHIVVRVPSRIARFGSCVSRIACCFCKSKDKKPAKKIPKSRADVGGIRVNDIFDIYQSRPVQMWAGVLKAVMSDQSKRRGHLFSPIAQAKLLSSAPALIKAGKDGATVANALSPILGDLPHLRYRALSLFCALVRDVTEPAQLASTLGMKMLLQRGTGKEKLTMEDVERAKACMTVLRAMIDNAENIFLGGVKHQRVGGGAGFLPSPATQLVDQPVPAGPKAGHDVPAARPPPSPSAAPTRSTSTRGKQALQSANSIELTVGNAPTLPSPPRPPPATASNAAPPSASGAEMDPQYAQYFKMLKMKVPRPAIENKMRAAGLDPSVLDGGAAPGPGGGGGRNSASSRPSTAAPQRPKNPMASAGLLGQIQGGKKLKKATTNDRSNPRANASAGPSGGAGGGGAMGGAFAAMLLARRKVIEKDDDNDDNDDGDW